MSLKGKTCRQVTAGYERLYGDDSARPIDAGRDRNIINGRLRCRVEQHRALNAAKREKVEIRIGIISTPERDSRLSGEVSRRHTIRGECAVDAHHQHIILIVNMVGDVEGEGQ